MIPKIDLFGKKFGRLTVVGGWSRLPRGKFIWECACECGSKKAVAGDRLRNGHTKSCGCLHSDWLIARNKARAIPRVPKPPRLPTIAPVPRVRMKRGDANRKHGAAGKNHTTWTAEYRAWISMKTRCSDKYTQRDDYPNYYGRGIRICERWLESYHDFLSDMGPRPSPQHSLDRINNDGNYEPGNCRWATAHEQAANKRPRRKKVAA